MEQIQTVKIQYLAPSETYTVHIKRNGAGWIGWIPEIPEIKCEENTQEELLKTMENKLHAVLTAEWEVWCKQLEEDVEAGKLDHLLEEAAEDLRAGRCKDL